MLHSFRLSITFQRRLEIFKWNKFLFSSCVYVRGYRWSLTFCNRQKLRSCGVRCRPALLRLVYGAGHLCPAVSATRCPTTHDNLFIFTQNFARIVRANLTLITHFSRLTISTTQVRTRRQRKEHTNKFITIFSIKPPQSIFTPKLQKATPNQYCKFCPKT